MKRTDADASQYPQANRLAPPDRGAAGCGDGRHLRQVRDGEIQTACQATCPTEAIIFGNINDPDSRVSKMKAQKRNYGLLEDLNTKPRTTYLAALRNPNPEIEA